MDAAAYIPNPAPLVAADAEALAHAADRTRRIAEAEAARLLQHIEASGAHIEAGFRQVAGWGRAVCNWSGPEAHRLAKLGRSFVRLPQFAEACLAGRISVSAMHAVAGVASNPRVAHHLAEADVLFTEWACTTDFDELAVLLHHWAELADENGARSRHDRAARERHASLSILGERSYLDAAGHPSTG